MTLAQLLSDVKNQDDQLARLKKQMESDLLELSKELYYELQEILDKLLSLGYSSAYLRYGWVGPNRNEFLEMPADKTIYESFFLVFYSGVKVALVASLGSDRSENRVMFVDIFSTAGQNQIADGLSVGIYPKIYNPEKLDAYLNDLKKLIVGEKA